MTRCAPCREQEVLIPEKIPVAPEGRSSPEDIPMYRYIHPIPQPPAENSNRCEGTPASAALLEALEQQTRLLTELLGAVTSLTAACLCRFKSE